MVKPIIIYGIIFLFTTAGFAERNYVEIPIEKRQSITLELDTVRARSREGFLLRTREGFAVTSSVPPFFVNLATRHSLINPDGVKMRGESPILARGFRITFANGSFDRGFETRTRLIGSLEGLNDNGEIVSVLVTGAKDTDRNGYSRSRVNVSSSTSEE